MSMPRNIVIVGAGLAGARAAEALRTEGFDGRVTLVGEEPVRPYERPPLSKAYLRGEADFDGAAVHIADFCSQDSLEGRRGPIDDRDISTQVPSRGRDLAANPAGSDHDDRC